jgi:hypothetical protein
MRHRDITDTWVAYLDLPAGPLMLRSSDIIIVSRTTGAVLCAGSASDER